MKRGSFFNDFLYTFSSSFASMMLGALSVIVFPKFLSPTQYGEYQLYLLYVGYTILLSFGVPHGVYLLLGGRGGSRPSPKQLGHLILVAMLISLCGMAALFSLGFVFRLWTSVFFAVCVSLTVPLECTNFFLLYVLQTTDEIRSGALAQLLWRMIALPLSLLYVIFFPGDKSIDVIIALDIIGRFVQLGFSSAVCYKRRIISFRTAPDRRKRLRIIPLAISGSQLLLSTNSGAVITGIARMGIQIAWGIGAFAGASLAMSVSNMFSRFANSVATPLFPRLRYLDDNESGNLYRSASLFISLVFYLFALIAPIASLVLSIWLPYYGEELQYVSLLMPVCLTESKSTVLVSNYYKSYRLEVPLSVINLSAILFSVGVAICGYVMRWPSDTMLCGMVLSLVLRSAILELYLLHIRDIPDKVTILCDVLMALLMTMMYYLGIFGTVLYSIICGLLIWRRRDSCSIIVRTVISMLKRK